MNFKKILAGLLIWALVLVGGTVPTDAQGGELIVGRGAIRDVVVSPDGSTVAVASSIGIWFYDAADLKAEPRLVRGHTDEVTQIAFSPDGALLVSGSTDRTGGVWDVAKGERKLTLEGHESTVTSVAFSPDGTLIATGGASGDNEVRLWDAETGRSQGIFKGHSNSVTGLAFSPDGKQLLSTSSDQSALLWDVASGKQLEEFKDHKGRVTRGAYSPNGDLFGTVASDGVLNLYDAKEFTLVQSVEVVRGSLSGLTFSADGSLIGVATTSRNVQIYEAATGKNLNGFETHRTGVVGIAFSPDGSLLYTGGSDNALTVHDVNSGREEQAIRGLHAGSVSAFVFSPDGTRAIFGTSSDPFIRVMDVTSGSLALVIDNESFPVALAFSPDGATIAAAASNDVQLHDAASGDSGDRFNGEQNVGAVSSLTFTPDGSKLVVGYSLGPIRVFDVASGRITSALDGHTASVRSVSVNADGTKVYSTSIDGSVRIWSLE